jgi:hypothetical protein
LCFVLVAPAMQRDALAGLQTVRLPQPPAKSSRSPVGLKSKSRPRKAGDRRMIANELHQGTVTFELPNHDVQITTRDLEKMRHSLEAYLQHHADRRDFVDLLPELHQSRCFIVDNRTAFIGGWRLEYRDNSFMLSLYPGERTAINIIHHVILAQHGSRWDVQALTVERVRAR